MFRVFSFRRQEEVGSHAQQSKRVHLEAPRWDIGKAMIKTSPACRVRVLKKGHD